MNGDSIIFYCLIICQMLIFGAKLRAAYRPAILFKARIWLRAGIIDLLYTIPKCLFWRCRSSAISGDTREERGP